MPPTEVPETSATRAPAGIAASATACAAAAMPSRAVREGCSRSGMPSSSPSAALSRFTSPTGTPTAEPGSVGFPIPLRPVRRFPSVSPAPMPMAETIPMPQTAMLIAGGSCG